MDKSINDIGDIIQSCINKPIVREFCTLRQGLSYNEKEKIKRNFSMAIGYCILFRNSEDIEDYLKISGKKARIYFLKLKVAKLLNISENEIQKHRDKIFKYIYTNFKENGYVFHGTNSFSANKKLSNGMIPSQNIEHKQELLRISYIYKKYNSFVDPLGYASRDIIDGKNGWFYDAIPKHSLYYANSPEWFGEFCGNNNAYSYLISDELKNGYANRDYNTSLEAITVLMNDLKMNENDRKEVLTFFDKCWNLFKDTKPILILIPSKEVVEVKPNSFTIDSLLNDVIECYSLLPYPKGFGSYIKINQHTDKIVSSEKLSSVDLTSLLPRIKISEDRKKEITLTDCIKKLKGFDLSNLRKAQEFIKSLEKDSLTK